MSHFLPPDLPEPAARYIESMPPGRVELFSLAPLDRTGVACWNAIFLNADGTRFHGVTPHGVGYGTTDAEAIVGTTGELAEAVHSAGAIWRFPRRTGSYAALSAELGSRGIADPLTLCLPAGSPVDHDTVMEWVPAQRWPGGETVLVPTEIAACSVGDFTPGYQPFTTPITNGLGAGPTLDFAIGHGICELLQRDGNGVGFRAMDRGIVLDLRDGPADPRTRALLDRLAAMGIKVMPKFASDEFGVAGIYCVGGERDGRAPFPIMVTAAGEAASLDREQALRKSLFEFAAARVRKAFSHAPLAAIAHIAPPGYLDRFRSYHSLAGEESRALRDMMAWCDADGATLRGYLADTVLSRRTTRRFDELPTWDGPARRHPDRGRTGPAFRRRRHGNPVRRFLARRQHRRARGEGHRPRPRSRDHELLPHRRARRAQAAGARFAPGGDRRTARGHRPRPPPGRRGRAPWRPGLARHRRGGPHRGPALSSLPRTRGAQRTHRAGATGT